MAWEYITMGDAEAAVVDILMNTPELDDYGPPEISTNLVGYEFRDRWIVVSQEGGSFDWPVVEHPRIDISVFAENRSICRDIADICRASVLSAAGTYRGHGLVLCWADVEMGLTRAPDRRTGSVRYIFSLRLTTRPTTEGAPQPPD